MRGTTARRDGGFRSAFLTDERTAEFDAADLGGLILLMARAWIGGSIPSDATSLATLSRLGAAWESSRLAASIPDFFFLAEERLFSIDLQEQAAHRDRVRVSKVASGRRGGLSKAVAFATSRLAFATSRLADATSPPLADARRLVANATSPLADATQGAEGAKTDKTDEVQPPELSIPAPGTVKCTIIDPPASAEVDAHSSTEIIPPHTPLYTDSSISSFDGGPGEGVSFENSKQVDLFGTPIKAPRRLKKATPTSDDREAAALVVDAYMDEVGPEHRRTIAADNNVAKWLAEGVTVADLRLAVKNYARICDRGGRDALYRNAAHNFFGRQNPIWRAHLKGADETPSKPRNTGPAGRIRTGKSYEGIGVTAYTAGHDAAAPADAPIGQGAECGPNPFRTPRADG